MSIEVYNEEISLRRLEVALKRADWRMFADATTRLVEELDAGSAFTRRPAWTGLLARASAHDELPDAHKAALRDAVARVLAVDARVLAGAAAVAAEGGPALALVDMWRSPLDAPAAHEAFRRWLTRPGPAPQAPGRARLRAWLDEGLGLPDLGVRAQLALAAEGAGLAAPEPAWVESYFAGLRVALAASPAPLAGLGEVLAGQGPAVALTADPSLAWEQAYGDMPGGFAAGPSPVLPALSVAQLGGALALGYCPACRDARADARFAVVAACPGCGGPAWPMVAPPGRADWLPPPLRATWEWAADLLRAAPTWVLVHPPAGEDPLAAWLVGRMAPGRRAIVVADEAAHRPWRQRLEAAGAAAVVTSAGPADEVLGFLLQGGVPDLAPAAQPPQYGPKKKRR